LFGVKIASYKSQLFSKLRGEANEVLEVGIGTGPNLKYYVTDASMHVFGIDPNRKMEKYARAAAQAAGLSPENFEFIQAVRLKVLPLLLLLTQCFIEADITQKLNKFAQRRNNEECCICEYITCVAMG